MYRYDLIMMMIKTVFNNIQLYCGSEVSCDTEKR